MRIVSYAPTVSSTLGIRRAYDFRFSRESLIYQGRCSALYVEKSRCSVRILVKVSRASNAPSADFVLRNARFFPLNEAAALNRLRNPNIRKCLGTGQVSGGHHFVALEYIDGKPLCSNGHYLALSVDDALIVTRRAAESLDHTHSYGLVHADVKPDNILVIVQPVLRVKLIDFELARRKGEFLPFEGPHQRCGIPGYMLRKNREGWTPPGVEDDIFGLGLTLFEMIARQKALNLPAGVSLPEAYDAFAVERAALAGRINDLPIAEAVKNLLYRMTGTNGAEMFSSCREIVEEIEGIIS